MDKNASNAIQLLEVGGTLAEGAVIAVGSWVEFRHWSSTKVPDRGLRLRLVMVGEGYKTTRRLAAVMGTQLYTVTISAITQGYVDLLRIHAKGLRRLQVSQCAGKLLWVPRLLGGAGILDRCRLRCALYETNP